MNALDRVIKIANGQSALAMAIGGTPQLVNNWVRRGGVVPQEHCPAIERAYASAVTCEELRPDVSWVRIPDPDWPHPDGRPLVDHCSNEAV